MLNAIVSAPAFPFASVIACRREPAPASAVVVTVKVAGVAAAAMPRASAARSKGEVRPWRGRGIVSSLSVVQEEDVGEPAYPIARRLDALIGCLGGRARTFSGPPVSGRGGSLDRFSPGERAGSAQI